MEHGCEKKMRTEGVVAGRRLCCSLRSAKDGVLCPSSVIFQLSSFFSPTFCWRNWRNDGFRCYPCSHGRPIPPVEDQHRYAVLRSSRGVHSQIRLPSQSLVWGVHAREARANLSVFRSRTVLRLFVHLHAPFFQRLCRRLEGICIGSLGVKLC